MKTPKQSCKAKFDELAVRYANKSQTHCAVVWELKSVKQKLRDWLNYNHPRFMARDMLFAQNISRRSR